MQHSLRFFGMALACAAVVSACGGGGGGGGGSSTKVGVFSDSVVEGLTYTTGGTTGLTDASGRFTYTEGQTVTFSVGGIVLGSTTGKPFVSPVSLVSGATDETHTTVTNIAKFLQTIDLDNNPANGIRLTAAIRAAATGRTINFAQIGSDYDSDGNVTGAYAALTIADGGAPRTGVNDTTARAHLRSTLLTAMAGTYSGSYSGGGSGTFNFTVNSSGTITSGTISSGGTISGNIGSGGGFSSSNAATMSGAAVTVGFVGSVNAGNSTVAGTWSVTGSGVNLSGSFSGTK